LIASGGAYYYKGDEKVRMQDRTEAIPIHEGLIVQAGKKKICKVQLTD